VAAYAKKKGLVFPILIDNDQKNWNAWRCRFWPSTGLVDKKGRVRAAWEGELDWQDSGTYKKVEQAIETLRKESGI
jgi:peroxiredoxin